MADRVPVPAPQPGDLERLLEKVGQTPECWDWQAGCFSSGYGAFSLEGKSRRAHRVLYVWMYGEPPENKELEHVCENKRCVRPHPDHVWPSSHRDNTLKNSSPPSVNAKKTWPDCGHSLEFTYTDPRGWRSCSQCRREAVARHYEANRERINARKRANRKRVVHEEKPCEHCGESFTPERSTGRLCRRRACINSRQRENRNKRLCR